MYLDYLLTSQPEYGTHIAEQLKRLRQAQPNFSRADSELFDIDKIEQQTRDALQRNKLLNQQLKQLKQQENQVKSDGSDRTIDIPLSSNDVKVKSQSEQIDEMRVKIFDLLDYMSTKKQELNDKFVPISICTQLQQAIRDAEVFCFV